jgi:tetratricopeptide (TPR) repeat protein
MGELQLRIGNLAEAEALLKRAIAIDEEQFEPDKSETASDLDLLGRVYLEQGRVKEARAAFERSFGIRTRLPGATEVPTSRVSLGDYFFRTGDLAGAETEYRQALSLIAPDDEGWAITRFYAHAGLARVAAGRRRLAEARAEIDRALASVARAWPSGHPELTKLEELARAIQR